MNNQPDNKEDKKNFLTTLEKQVKDNFLIYFLGSLVAAFGMGFGAYVAIVNATGKVVIDKLQEDKAKCLDELIKNEFNLQQAVPECRMIPKYRINVLGILEKPSDKISGNFTVSGELTSTDIINGKLIKDKTKAWLLATPNNKDCYVQGYIPTLNDKFTQETSSIVEQKKYTISLLAVDDQDVNKELENAQKNNPPEIPCVKTNLANFQLAQLIIDNSGSGINTIENPPANTTGNSNNSNNSNPTSTTSAATPKTTPEKSKTFNLASSYGSKYGGITVNKDAENQKITLTGKTSGVAGYVIEKDPQLAELNNQKLILKISGTENTGNKLFKLEVDGNSIEPTEPNIVFQNDTENYITAKDGEVSFNLPETVTKIEFVFYNPSLNNLTISATATDKN